MAAGLTPLVVDNSKDAKYDTFMSYQTAQIIDAKMAGLSTSAKVRREAGVGFVCGVCCVCCVCCVKDQGGSSVQWCGSPYLFAHQGDDTGREPSLHSLPFSLHSSSPYTLLFSLHSSSLTYLTDRSSVLSLSVLVLPSCIYKLVLPSFSRRSWRCRVSQSHKRIKSWAYIFSV